MEEVRLQKYLSMSGIASRRKAEEMIAAGRVKVNGMIVVEPGTKVKPDCIVEVDGKKITPDTQKIYIILNKPTGYVTTVKDQFSRPTVIDLVKGIGERVYPVGRLDYDTSGLLILTNDGDFTYRITHPSYEKTKVYTAEIKGLPETAEINAFRAGLNIEDYVTSPAKFKILERRSKSTVVEITIHEGRNRQIRKMCEAIGHPIIKLKRTAIGSLILGDLKEGSWRVLNENEINSLL
jgi:23S rRNA pseudouridine2605 synthase